MAKIVSELKDGKCFEGMASVFTKQREVIFRSDIIADNTQQALDKFREVLKTEYPTILPDLWEILVRPSTVII